MPLEETTRVKLWLVPEMHTELSYGFSTMPKGDQSGRKVWLPRSQLSHVSKHPFNPATEYQPAVVEMPVWLAEKKGL